MQYQDHEIIMFQHLSRIQCCARCKLVLSSVPVSDDSGITDLTVLCGITIRQSITTLNILYLSLVFFICTVFIARMRANFTVVFDGILIA